MNRVKCWHSHVRCEQVHVRDQNLSNLAWLMLQASDPLLASLPLRISPPLASVGDSIDENQTVVNSAFQIVASVMGAHIISAVALTQEQVMMRREIYRIAL